MSKAATLQISLTEDELQFVREQVASGEFTSESDLVSTGLDRIREESMERRQWEQEVLVPRLVRMRSEDEQGISIEQLMENMAERRRLRQRAS